LKVESASTQQAPPRPIASAVKPVVVLMAEKAALSA
jgi:hypothetical protein